jgi:hypothetical protein
MRSTVRFLVVITLACASTLSAQQKLTTAEANAHVGEQATVCGLVASTHHAATSRGQPTFINLDKPYPNEVFTILIWGSDRPKFGNPEQKYSGKHVCVTGTIGSYRGVPEIIAHDPGVLTPTK